MKVGNLLKGLEVVDVKQVNKLNLIQFLKEVDSYLQQGYQLDVKSGRQVGLVLQCKMFKTEAASSVKVGSVGGQVPTESVGVASKEAESVPEPQSVQSTNVEDAVEPVIKEEAPVAEDIVPLTAKKTTTRSKKTAQ